MKKIITILIFCLFGISSLSAQEKVAIIPFTGGSGDEGDAIAQILKAEFTELSNFKIAPHTTAMDKILADKNIQKTGLTNGDTMARLGKEINTQYVSSGTVSPIGGDDLMNVAIIEVLSLAQVASAYSV